MTLIFYSHIIYVHSFFKKHNIQMWSLIGTRSFHDLFKIIGLFCYVYIFVLTFIKIMMNGNLTIHPFKSIFAISFFSLTFIIRL